VYLRSVLPLLEWVVPARPELATLVRGRAASVAFVAGDLGARLTLGEGAVRVEPGTTADVLVRFSDTDAMSRFFAGKPVVPRITPWMGMTHPVLLTRAARLLAALRVLEPPRPGVTVPPAERALRVRLMLTLVTRALSQLHREGHPEMRALAERSPERVYQWTVGTGDIAAWLRMHDGRVHSGLGAYARRRPFVHFQFGDVDAAFAVLTATGSQMSGFRGGVVQTWGSPEYVRKIALLMQKVDELLVEG
jgi:hypothetical protein